MNTQPDNMLLLSSLNELCLDANFSPWAISPGWSLNSTQNQSVFTISRAEMRSIMLNIKSRFATLEKQGEDFLSQLHAAHHRSDKLDKDLLRAQQELVAVRQTNDHQNKELKKELGLIRDLSHSREMTLSYLRGGLNRAQGELTNLKGVTLLNQQELQQHTREMEEVRQEQTALAVQTSQVSEVASHLGVGLIVVCVCLLATAVAMGWFWYKKGRVLLRSLIQQREESMKEKADFFDLISNHLASAVSSANNGGKEPDHSSMLKFVNEIARMEVNMMRMDSSAKGYKQLSRGLERIRNNFAAIGYEIVPMLGLPYQDGLRADIDFIVDDSLPEGERRITAVLSPQVNYKGTLIQKANITVSQNI